MSRILKVSQSDYRVQVQDGGIITLDVGQPTNGGKVVITGDLEVQGETTTINTTEMTVEDRVITLNRGEQSAGVHADGNGNKQSGIEIERGTLGSLAELPDVNKNAQLIFDEDLHWYSSVTQVVENGGFILRTADGIKNALQLNTIVNGGGANSFVFDLQGGLGVLSVANSTNYYQRVTNDNDIPNWKTITNYVTAQNGVATVDRLFYPATAAYGSEDSKIQAFASDIEMFIAGDIIATVSANGFTVGNIRINANQIIDIGAGATDDLTLAAITNNVVVDGVLNLTDQALVPTPVAGQTKLYSSTVGGGGTGLYASNTTKSSEMVSKQRAVLLSIVL
jgi:hypothetical protein